MDTVGPLVLLEAKAGKEDDLASLLAGALPLAQQEPQTTAWFGVRFEPARFAIFDAFPDESGRDAHLAGQIAAALMEQAAELLARTPSIEMAEVLAESSLDRI
jgi:quinol monooxygenase YgiN